MVSDKTGLVDWSKIREEAFHFFLIVLILSETLKFDAELFRLDVGVVFLLMIDCPSSMYLPDEGEDEESQEVDCGKAGY